MYKTQRNYENAQRMLFDGVGQYDIPELEPVQFDNAEFIGFNYARNAKEPENKAVHFFLDDYQFTRVWTDPDKYTAMLQRFKYVLTPDFSLYTDFQSRYRSITITVSTGSARTGRCMESMLFLRFAGAIGSRLNGALMENLHRVLLQFLL